MIGFKILVIEDNEDMSKEVVAGFTELGADHVDTAFNIPEALRFLFSDGQVVDYYDIIVVDACVPGDNYNTYGIIRQLRAANYPGVLVAASSFGDYRKDQIRDGCTLDGGRYKWEIPTIVCQAMTSPPAD